MSITVLVAAAQALVEAACELGILEIIDRFDEIGAAVEKGPAWMIWSLRIGSV
jgi:hypothetical protein